ncbi:MAG: divergent polysaccharide deacetylase family protein [Desulfitobacterium hafniense]|nr:divergent polysaccharide deacetylase family protein [Desulfitobacterium hafniense]
MYRKLLFIVISKRQALVLLLILLILALGGVSRIIYVISSGIKDKVIVIDPGHGGQDPGAQYGGVKEKDLNLDIAYRLKSVLEQKGSRVILTRDTDKDFFLPNFVKGRMAKRAELNHRVQLALTNKADIFVSIHANGFPRRSSYGMETYYHLTSAAGKELADRIQKHLYTIQPDNKRSAKAGDYYVLNQTEMPAVLVEVGFLSNTRERALLITDRYKDSIALAISNGIETFFNDFPLGVNESSPTLAQQNGPDKTSNNQFNLYFPADSFEQLTSEQRIVTSQEWLALTTAQRIKLMLEELFKGPKTNNLVFPLKSTNILGVNIQNSIATINLSQNVREEFSGGALEEEMAIKSIVWTVSQLPEVKGTRILIEGDFGDSIGGHVLLDHTFTPSPPVGKIALVIDDFGINNPGTKEMLELGIPITAAVMPNLMFTKEEAQLIHNKGYEIILHMPMEAKSGQANWYGPGTLTTNLSNEEIRNRLNQGLDSVMYAIGISNHMGSKATEDERVIKELLKIAKERQLIILDSKTSDNSHLYKEAKKNGNQAAIRDIFLDNSNSLTSIKQQIRSLKDLAKKNGKAIGIGHVGPQGVTTARAIKEMLPELEKEGIQIVPLSELVQ